MKVKKWNITLLSFNKDKKIKSDYFTTADTDAYLQVQLTDKMIDADEVIFTMYNKKDESLVSKKGIWENNIASFHLTDEIIVHNGEWVFQVVFISEKKYVSRPLTFTIHNYLLDNYPPKLEIIENWNLLVKQADFLVDELEQYANAINQSKKEIDNYKNEIMILLNALKIANVEEEKRKQNEITRMENEIGRVDTENERITQENNRVIRENDRAGSETIRETNEADRIANENERKTNENTRELLEDSRITQETIRRNNEDVRMNRENTRITQETIRRNNETQRQNTLAPRITSLETIINSADLVNYGIESGNNNRGNWVKFPDGTMIQWYGSTTKNYSVTSTWGSLYYSGYESWTYPVPFIQSPRVIAEYNSFTGDAWVIGGGERKTATNSGQFYLIRPASASVTGNIDYIAIGRWK